MPYILLLHGAGPSPSEPIEMEIIERAVESASILVTNDNGGIEIRPVMDPGEM